MSLYSIAEMSLTTAADRKRRPFVGNGQVVRALILCAIFFGAFFIRTHHG